MSDDVADIVIVWDEERRTGKEQTAEQLAERFNRPDLIEEVRDAIRNIKRCDKFFND